MFLNPLYQSSKEVIGEAVCVYVHLLNIRSVIDRNLCRLRKILLVSSEESTVKRGIPIGQTWMRAYLIPNCNAKFLNPTSVAVLPQRFLNLPSDISDTQLRLTHLLKKRG